jgi:hypothetical protein
MIAFTIPNGSIYSATGLFTTGGDISLLRTGMTNAGARATWNVLQSVNPSLSAEYCYPLEIGNT